MPHIATSLCAGVCLRLGQAENYGQYNFQPKVMLRAMVSVLVHLGSFPEFVQACVQCGRISADSGTFERAVRQIRKHNIGTVTGVCLMCFSAWVAPSAHALTNTLYCLHQLHLPWLPPCKSSLNAFMLRRRRQMKRSGMMYDSSHWGGGLSRQRCKHTLTPWVCS